METTDLTTKILQNIRDDITKLEAKLDGKIDKLEAKLDGKIDKFEAKLDSEIDKFEAKLDSEIAAVRKDMQKLVTRDEFRETIRVLDERIDRMHARLVENDVRATAAHQDLQATLGQIMTYLGGHGSLEARVDRCERDIIDLKERVL
jgi:chromosome segregation ATPase